jgi:hypothetical protein
MNTPPKTIDKTEFEKRRAKIYALNTESDQIANEQKLKIQAEKEMVIIKDELTRRGQTSNAVRNMGSFITEEYADYIADK